MRALSLSVLLALAACDRPSADVLRVGDWQLSTDGRTLDVEGPHGARYTGLAFSVGDGTQTMERSAGHFRVTEEDVAWRSADGVALVDGGVTITLGDEVLVLSVADDHGLVFTTTEAPTAVHTPRWKVSFACDTDEPFLGAGAHTDGIDHHGEAFPLFVSEQGIGKADTDATDAEWFLVGRKHSTYFPVPFLLRAAQPSGVLLETTTRVEVDLCATDPARASLVAWDATPSLRLIAGARALDVVESLTEVTGRPRPLPDWALTPWNDAVRGPARVREVAATLREAGAPSSVIWSEDWRGGIQTPTGYRLPERWEIDRTLYPDAEDVAAELEADGFKWFAYFAPFVGLTEPDGMEAVAAGAVIRDAAGEPYAFPGITFKPTSKVDLSTETGRSWAREKLEAAVALGFDGWMVDFGEWLPTDAVLASGEDALAVHNVYPEAWQSLVDSVLEPAGGVSFCRAGWTGAVRACPIAWLGDQRTDFAADDGLPTVLPLALGLAASGVPVITHDVAGYLSLGNPASDRELWWRWAWLGAFSPILRTHHGSSDLDNHQFDTDAETLALWVAASVEHMRLFPYRAALAQRASERGTPMVMPTAFQFDGEPWDRADAWLLGPSLLVAPVMTRDARTLDVTLPAGVDWYDWWTRAPATSGAKDVPLDTIPVFVASGSTIPLLDTIPDTLAPTTNPDLVDLADADASRVLLLFGGGGAFEESDGTTYAPSGAPTGPGEVTQTLAAGTVDVAGVSLVITGQVERRYTVVVIP